MVDKEDHEELFGPVIFSYTDQQAVEDGVLFDVFRLSKCDVNRITRAVYGWLGGFEQPDELPGGYCNLENTAKEALNKSKDKELVEFRYKGQRFWMMDNETGYRTIMFPEDY